MRTNPGCVVSQSQIAALFGSAYLEAAMMTNTINGFQKAGICPVNRNTDINFSETTPVADTCDMTINSHLCFSANHPSVINSHPLVTNTQISAFSTNLN